MAALLLSAHPLSEQPLLHLHPAHKTDLPMYLAQASAGARSYQRRSEGHEPLLVALVTKEHTWRQSSVTGNLVLLPCHRVLPTVCRTRWGMAPGPCFRRVGSPSVKPSMSLFPTPCSFFGLEAGQVQAFQACGVRSNNLKLPVLMGVLWFSWFFFFLSLSSFALFFLIELTTFC